MAFEERYLRCIFVEDVNFTVIGRSLTYFVIVNY